MHFFSYFLIINAYFFLPSFFASCYNTYAMKTLLLAPILAFSLLASAAAPNSASAASGRYWISSTGKTHNSSCRYYANCKGFFSDTPSGDNCKICGGAR